MEIIESRLSTTVRRFPVALIPMAFLIVFAASSVCWAGDASSGEKLYKTKCAVCHGDKGQGGMAKKLNDPEYLKKNMDEDIRGVIVNGVKGMPSYKSMLKPDEIDGLVAFIRTWAK